MDKLININLKINIYTITSHINIRKEIGYSHPISIFHFYDFAKLPIGLPLKILHDFHLIYIQVLPFLL